MSQAQIASYYESHPVMIFKVMKRLQIPRRSKGREGAEHHQFKDGKASVKYRKLIVKNECVKCKVTEKLCVHHKNDDHYDNRISNLEILCWSCHNSMNKKAWWAKKKALANAS